MITGIKPLSSPPVTPRFGEIAFVDHAALRQLGQKAYADIASKHYDLDRVALEKRFQHHLFYALGIPKPFKADGITPDVHLLHDKKSAGLFVVSNLKTRDGDRFIFYNEIHDNATTEQNLESFVNAHQGNVVNRSLDARRYVDPDIITWGEAKAIYKELQEKQHKKWRDNVRTIASGGGLIVLGSAGFFGTVLTQLPSANAFKILGGSAVAVMTGFGILIRSILRDNRENHGSEF